ncbi:hypothetical protein Tco_1229485 [Tanacetum coccineum]
MPRTMGGNDDEAISSRSKHSRQYETWKRYCFHKFIMNSYYGKVATKTQSLENNEMLRIKLREAGSNEKILTSVAWIRSFNINEPIYSELCHEFYSTYEFDEVCANDELQTKKIIKFRLGGRGLRSDDHFNAQEYWLSISRKENLSLSKSHVSNIRSLVLRVIHKMITYGLCQTTTGYDKIQNNDLWLLSMFDARHQNGYANVAWLIARWMKRKGADLDMTILRELIDSEGRLILEDPQLGVLRVTIPRPPRALMQDLYDKMGKTKIRQGAIERMSYKQSYHWDRQRAVLSLPAVRCLSQRFGATDKATNPPYKFKWTEKTVPVAEGSFETTTEGYMENYKNFSQDIQDQLNAKSEAVQIILTGIDNEIYSIVDACPNTCEMWKAIERLKQGKSINVQDLETNLYWEFGKFTSRDGESLESYYSRSQPAATKNKGKAIVNSPTPTYDQEPVTVADNDEMSKEKEIDKLMALISLSFKKIYKPTNNNLRTSSNIGRTNQENYPRINRGTEYHNQRVVNVVEAGENVAYHKEKMLLCKQEEAGVQLNAEQADCKDDTADEPDDQELEAHYISRHILQKVLQMLCNSDPSLMQTLAKGTTMMMITIMYEHNIIIDSLDLDMCNNGETVDEYDDDLAKERDLLASLIEKLKCEIEDFKTKNKSLESSNNHFKEANNELSKTNQLMFKDLKKFQAELDRYHDVNYASKVAIDCAKAKGDLMSYKIESEKSFNEYTRKINDLNQTISDMKKEVFVHQETISIMSQEKEAQTKFHKTRDDKELEKIISLENKIKVLDDIVYKTGQSVQTMNMLNHNCKMSYVKPEFLKKAQIANPHLYDIGCYNDNLALMLAPESD